MNQVNQVHIQRTRGKLCEQLCENCRSDFAVPTVPTVPKEWRDVHLTVLECYLAPTPGSCGIRVVKCFNCANEALLCLNNL